MGEPSAPVASGVDGLDGARAGDRWHARLPGDDGVPGQRLRGRGLLGVAIVLGAVLATHALLLRQGRRLEKPVAQPG